MKCSTLFCPALAAAALASAAMAADYGDLVTKGYRWASSKHRIMRPSSRSPVQDRLPARMPIQPPADLPARRPALLSRVIGIGRIGPIRPLLITNH
jgi:hypothetical protein